MNSHTVDMAPITGVDCRSSGVIESCSFLIEILKEELWLLKVLTLPLNFPKWGFLYWVFLEENFPTC